MLIVDQVDEFHVVRAWPNGREPIALLPAEKDAQAVAADLAKWVH